MVGTLNLVILIASIIHIRSEFEYLFQEINNRVAQDPKLLSKHSNSSSIITYKNEDYIHTYGEKVIAAGFRFESHKVVTEDGYILTVWRIPGKLGNYSREAKKPVILQHGLLDDSYTFLVLRINMSLPLQLALQG